MKGEDGFEMIILRNPTSTQADFEKFAEAAKDAGATHMVISALVRKSRYEITDPKDPYLYWAIHNPSFFKAALPPEIKDTFIPEDYAQEYLEALRARNAVLERLGLKAVFSALEPYWLPEAVYSKHPSWRGPRCDHPRRSRHPRFAPCIDQSEVLDLYRRAVAELLKDVPTIEIITLATNDSGSGVCWSANLYNSANGPAWCRGREMGQRVVGFMRAIRQGAADSGAEVDVYINQHFEPGEVDLIERSLEPHMGILARGGPDIPPLAGAGTGGLFPVIGLNQPISLVEGLERTYKAGGARVMISVGDWALIKKDWQGVELTLSALKKFLQSPTDGYWARLCLLRDLAGEEVGPGNASDLTELWEEMRQGIRLATHYQSGGTLLRLGVVAQRWITRPLVPFPLELPPEHTDYYRRHQFQATTEEDAADLLNCQGSRMIDGRVQARFANRLFAQARSHFSRAARIAEKLASDSEKEDYFKRLQCRLNAANSLLRTMGNVASYQTLLDERLEKLEALDASGVGREVVLREPPRRRPGDPDRQMIYNIVRDEIDNTNELIRLLEEVDYPVLVQAETKEEEDTFTLGPDLTDQMRHKVTTALAHWLDYNRLWPRPHR